MNCDIVVVGAGPAGLITAREAAKRGANVIVLEEHKEIGIPCHCAGLLSIKGLREIGVPLRSTFIQNKLKGARFYSPSGLCFTVERNEAVACVVDRIIFDNFLATQAIDAGAEIKLNSRIQHINRTFDRMAVKSSNSLLHSNIVVDAEGVISRFVKRMGLPSLRSEGVLPALQFEVTDVDVDPDYAEIYFGKKIAPGFFAWVIPLNNDSARVGLACKNVNPLERLKTFLSNRFNRFAQISIHSGHIISCGPIPRTYDDNFIVVGDAAGQVKITTGGGIILGGICAKIAGEIVAMATNRGTFTNNFLGNYEKLWKRRLGREFMLMRLARKTSNQFSDKIIDKIFNVIIKKNLQAELSIKGDMDYQADSISSFIKKRDLLKMFITAIPDIISFKA